MQKIILAIIFAALAATASAQVGPSSSGLVYPSLPAYNQTTAATPAALATIMSGASATNSRASGGIRSGVASP
jgi:hypothetical protein